MRKTSIGLVIALVLTLVAGLTLSQVNSASAQGESSVGVVVAYTPGVSITIIDENGNQIEYALDAAVKIDSPDGEKSIKVGSVVTIIAPASISKEKQVAVGVVVHTEKELLPSATPLVKNTPLPTNPPVTATPKVGETPTPVESVTATPVDDSTATPPPTENTKQDGTDVKSTTFIEWLASLFRQVLSGQ